MIHTKLFYTYDHPVMSLDPLMRLKDAHQKALIPDDVFDVILKRFDIAVDGINRIERASGIRFPIAYVEPSLVVTTSDPSVGYGILYARTIPLYANQKFGIIIQITAPLVAYGLKGTIHAVLAHEFLHYLELVQRVSTMKITSDTISSNLFENAYSDESRLFDPRAVFDDRSLINHITKRFPAGFRDRRLEDKVSRYWQKRQLPSQHVAIDSNNVKMTAESLAAAAFDPALLSSIDDILQKTSKLRKKRLY